MRGISLLKDPGNYCELRKCMTPDGHPRLLPDCSIAGGNVMQLRNSREMPAASTYDAFLSITRAVADPLRANILHALRQESFGVLELAHIFDVTQPALSHHLKILSRAGLVATRRDGNGIYYRRAQPRADCPLSDYLTTLYRTLDEFILDTALCARIDRVHADRAERSLQFFADHAGEFANQQALISTPQTYLPALREFVDAATCANKRALDVGPGEGETLLLLAEYFNSVLGIDNSPAMLERARQGIRTHGPKNVRLRLKEFEELRGPRHDLILLAMVLHHAASPRRFLAHAGRLLDDDGLLVIIELVSHEQTWAKDACGDLWLGFDPDELDHWAAAAGLTAGASQYLAQRNGFRIQVRSYQKGDSA
jgi:DNA-binding transcriptional ArsR family regulator/ubiquinone/menaquinone biosynthesis C-methylase UbiE